MTAPTRHLLARAATAAVTIGLLAGCTGGAATADPTSVEASAQPSPSATPSAVVQAPAWSATMDQVSVDGARDVAQYFLDLYPYVIKTGDTTEWDRLSHSECLFCADVRETFGSKPAQGTPLTADWTFVRATELDPGVYFSIELALVETDDDGVATDYSVLVGVLRDSDRWLIRAVQIDEVAIAGE